jgi:hypothetical protein
MTVAEVGHARNSCGTVPRKASAHGVSGLRMVYQGLLPRGQPIVLGPTQPSPCTGGSAESQGPLTTLILMQVPNLGKVHPTPTHVLPSLMKGEDHFQGPRDLSSMEMFAPELAFSSLAPLPISPGSSLHCLGLPYAP